MRRSDDGFDYQTYLRSPEWRVRRDAAVKRADGRCQLCNSAKSLNVHHRTYKRIGNEDPGDLTVLCNRCHRKFHGIMSDGVKTAPRSPRKANRWTIGQVEEAVIAALPEIKEARFSAFHVAPVVRVPKQRAAAALRNLEKAGRIKRMGKKSYARLEDPSSYTFSEKAA